MTAVCARIRALCACLIVALSLAVAPAIEAVKYGLGAMAAEADHRAFHAERGHGHELPHGHHDSTDHDHVGAALPDASGLAVHPAPQRTLRPDALAADGTIRDGPRRPPRLTMT
ncbi:hypothetical protein [Paracoccus yeei]|uniref:hypothetical protein n=1 Tax=Paracoccus yeei TaxID=147645 RepID=UPI003BF90390